MPILLSSKEFSKLTRGVPSMPFLLPHGFQYVAIMRLELIPVSLQKALPVDVFRNRRSLVERHPALLIRHLEEEEKCQLLDVIAVRQPIVAQDVAVIPKFLDKL